MSEVRNMRTLLASLVGETEGDVVSVADLLEAVGRRAYGPILLLLGFVALSPLTVVPGTSWLVALITFLIAAQIVFGRKRPWLPRRVLTVSFPRKVLIAGVEAMQRPAFIMDRLVSPRLTFLTAPPFIQLVAGACVLAALITFPLGLVPFGPVLPGLAVLLIGLGLTSRDGIVVLLAGSALVGGVLITLRFLGAVI